MVVIFKRSLGLTQIALLIILAVLISLGTGWGDAPCLKAEGDINGDGIPEEYDLNNNALTVTEGGKVLWQSPKGYAVDNIGLGDLTNDGKADIVITLWKKGSFGPVKPFWHSGKDDDYKHHLFIYTVEAGEFKPVWCSSNLDRPIVDFQITDLDGDGLNELEVLEGRYRKLPFGKHGIDNKGSTRKIVLKWAEWGLAAKE